MKIEIEGVDYNVQFNSLSKEKIPIVFLHGFLGSAKDWQFLSGSLNPKFNTIFIDLVGHGLSDSPQDEKHYSEDSIISSLKKIFKQLKLSKCIVGGYSMGGRAALSFALKNPNQVKGLILESTNPGIRQESEQTLRKNNDHKLSLRLESEELETFLGYWYNQTIFRSLKQEQIKNLIQLRNTNNKHGLAKVLRNFSTGKMKNKWDKLHKINCPTLLISGELDKKYCEISNVMSSKISTCQQKIIKNAGHNTHLENQFEYISVVNNFLTKYFYCSMIFN